MGKKNKSKQNNKRTGKDGFSNNNAPFPPSMPASFVYANTGFYAESAAGTGFQNVWALNSLFDPDVTNVGHQPLYYDQTFALTGPYSRYRVDSVQVTIEVYNTSSAPILAGWYVQPGAVDLPSITVLQEKPWGQTCLLGLPAASSGRKRWIINIPCPKALGVTKARYKDDDIFAGVYNGSPSKIGYLIIMIYGIGTIATATVHTRLKFASTAFERPAVGGS